MVQGQWVVNIVKVKQLANAFGKDRHFYHDNDSLVKVTVFRIFVIRYPPFWNAFVIWRGKFRIEKCWWFRRAANRRIPKSQLFKFFSLSTARNSVSSLYIFAIVCQLNARWAGRVHESYWKITSSGRHTRIIMIMLMTLLTRRIYICRYIGSRSRMSNGHLKVSRWKLQTSTSAADYNINLVKLVWIDLRHSFTTISA